MFIKFSIFRISKKINDIKKIDIKDNKKIIITDIL